MVIIVRSSLIAFVSRKFFTVFTELKGQVPFTVAGENVYECCPHEDNYAVSMLPDSRVLSTRGKLFCLHAA